MPSWEHPDLLKVTFIADTLVRLIMVLCLCCFSHSCIQLIGLLHYSESQMESQWTLVFLNRINLEKGVEIKI